VFPVRYRLDLYILFRKCSVSTEPLPSNDRGDTQTYKEAHRPQRYLISQLYFIFQNKESRLKIFVERMILM
jgi:hypothetical protein